MDNGRPHGLILANTGTPSAPTPRAVRAYLAKFLGSRRICPTNPALWWLIVHLAIIPKRARTSAERYRSVWTANGAPLSVAHSRLEPALQRAFDDAGRHVVVATGMSAGEPSMTRALRRLREAGAIDATVLPLFPQSAYSTTGVVSDELERARRKTRFKGEVQLIDSYAHAPVYASALAALVRRSGFDVEGDDKLLMSYHSIPHTDVEAGDTYELQVGASSLAIANALGLSRDRWTIGYQSRFDERRDWLGPSTRQVVDRMAQASTGRLFVLCPGFAVDCLETLLDIDRELRDYYFERVEAAHGAAERAARDFVYVPCLGATKAHGKVLFDVAVRSIFEEGE